MKTLTAIINFFKSLFKTKEVVDSTDCLEKLRRALVEYNDDYQKEKSDFNKN